MMRFRLIDIPKFVFQTLRGNYSVRGDYQLPTQPQITTFLYRVCLAICYVIRGELHEYYRFRGKWFMLAACTPTYGQISRVLSYLYGYNITITSSKATLFENMLYAEDTPQVFWYAEDTPAVYLGGGGNYTEAPIVNVPSALYNSPHYAQFIADLNLLTPFFITYTINVV